MQGEVDSLPDATVVAVEWGAMMGRRPPSDGDSSRPAALPRCCEAIGVQLAELRAARKVSVEDVASRLMLSRGQVLGLEQADASSFYTHAYFLKALRRYMAFFGVSEALLVDEPDAAFGLRMTLAEIRPRRVVTINDDRSHRWQRAAAGIAVVALGIGAYTYVGFTRDGAGPETLATLESAEPIPAQPVVVTASTPPVVRAQPAAAVLDQPRDESTVRVTVGKSTWIFVRYPDNRVVERRLGAGEELEVGPLPVYLAVGRADSVEVRVEDRPVALEPYIRDGQIRITRPELARLAPNRLPQ